jgi:hypothetical protein
MHKRAPVKWRSQREIGRALSLIHEKPEDRLDGRVARVEGRNVAFRLCRAVRACIRE